MSEWGTVAIGDGWELRQHCITDQFRLRLNLEKGDIEMKMRTFEFDLYGDVIQAIKEATHNDPPADSAE